MTQELLAVEVVEIPKGNRNKYEMNRDTGSFHLDRVLHSAIQYPVEYGYVPDTLARDGAPLDIMSLVTNPTFPGCVIECRVIGVLRMADEFGEDDKLLAVPVRDARFSRVQALTDVPEHDLKEIAHFFAVYRNLDDERASVLGWENADYARKVLRECRERWQAAGGSGSRTAP